MAEVLDLHRRVIAQTGGAESMLDLRALESAIAQPRATFESRDLHPSIADKAAALCHSLVLNHPFLDGNKRVGHAAMETSFVRPWTSPNVSCSIWRPGICRASNWSVG